MLSEKKKIIQDIVINYSLFLDQIRDDLEQLIDEPVYSVHDFIDITARKVLATELRSLARKDNIQKIDDNNALDNPKPKPLPECEDWDGKDPVCQWCIFYSDFNCTAGGGEDN